MQVIRDLVMAGGAAAAGESDPYIANVALLMHMDGTDASTTFTDEFSHTTAAVGNAQLDTAQKKFGTASALYDGGGDYTTVSPTITLAGDFTIECWVYKNVENGGYSPVISGNVSSYDFPIILDYSGGSYAPGNVGVYMPGGAAASTTGGTHFSSGQWYYVVCERYGTTVKLYIDGVQKASLSSSSTLSIQTIGGWSGGLYFNGWVDDVRITKDVARYGGTAPPVPTAAFPDPVDPHIANVTLLMHMEGADGGTTFTDEMGHTFTQIGTPRTEVDQKKFGATSAYFDGAGDWITCGSADFAFGTGDFTIECFVRFTSFSNSPTIFFISPTASEYAPYGLVLRVNTIGQIEIYLGNGSGWVVLVNGADINAQTTLNTWHHCAYSRSGTNLRIHLDGYQIYTVSNSTDITHQYLFLGNYADLFLTGYLDEVRITKGVCRYGSGNFTPPTAPFPNA